jgi:hypothetical protein
VISPSATIHPGVAPSAVSGSANLKVIGAALEGTLDATRSRPKTKNRRIRIFILLKLVGYLRPPVESRRSVPPTERLDGLHSFDKMMWCPLLRGWRRAMVIPRPHIADDRLAVLMDMHMLDSHVLPRAVPEAPQELHLNRESLQQAARR